LSSKTATSHVPQSEKTDWGTWLCLLPVLALPALLTLRLFPMVAPNEEPKWALFVVVGVIVAAGLTLRWLRSSSLISRPSPMTLGAVTFLLLVGLGIFVAPNPIEGVIRWSFWVFGFFIALAGVVLGRSSNPLIRQLTLWGLVLAAFWFCWRFLWMYRFEYGAPGYNFTVLFSPIGHVNFTADVLVLLIPWLALLTMTRGWGLALAGWVGAVACTVILLLGASRGGLLGVASGLLVGGAVWGAGVWQHRPKAPIAFNHLTALRWIALLAIPIVAWSLYQQSPYRYRDIDRVGQSLKQVVQETTSMVQQPKAIAPTDTHQNSQLQPSQSAQVQPPWAPLWDHLRPLLNDDRTGMYASALGMTFDAPWFGHGTGNFPFVYPAYSHRYTGYEDQLSSPTTYTTNPHNVLLQIATENGLPAALLFMVLWMVLILRGLRALFLRGDPLLVAGVSFAVGALVDAMLNHVFYNPASLFIAMLFAGWLWGKTTPETPPPPRAVPLPEKLHPPLRRWGGYAAILGVLVLAIWPSRFLLSERDVAFAMGHPNGSPQSAQSYRQAYEWDPYNFRAVFGVGLVMAQEQRWPEAQKLIEYFVRIAPNNPQGWHVLGSIYAQAGRLADAHSALQRALDLLPTYTPAKELLGRLDAFMATQGQPAQTP